jgi:hypothetical protein
MYALVRAGYAPESLASFLNDSMMNKGKTGGWLTDILGATHEPAQRYRQALKMIDELPQECKGRPPVPNEAFTAWQRGIVEGRVKSEAENIKGDQPLIDPALKSGTYAA